MKYSLLHNDQSGYALYGDKALVATWDRKTEHEYVIAQVESRMTSEDELVEITHRGAFSDELPAQVRPKLKPDA